MSLHRTVCYVCSSLIGRKVHLNSSTILQRLRRRISMRRRRQWLLSQKLFLFQTRKWQSQEQAMVKSLFGRDHSWLKVSENKMRNDWTKSWCSTEWAHKSIFLQPFTTSFWFAVTQEELFNSTISSSKFTPGLMTFTSQRSKVSVSRRKSLTLIDQESTTPLTMATRMTKYSHAQTSWYLTKVASSVACSLVYSKKLSSKTKEVILWWRVSPLEFVA